MVLGNDGPKEDDNGRLSTNFLGQGSLAIPLANERHSVPTAQISQIRYVLRRGSRLRDHAQDPVVIHACGKLMGLPIGVEESMNSCSGLCFSAARYWTEADLKLVLRS